MMWARRITDSELWAYLDGNLSLPSRLRIIVQLFFDARLSDRAKTFARQARYIRAIDRRVLAEPVPERLLRILRHAQIDDQSALSQRPSYQIQSVGLVIALCAAAACLAWLAF